MRGRTIFQCVEEEAKFLLGLFFTDSEEFEDDFLHLRLMNTHRAPPNFSAVEHHVIGS